MSKPKRFRDHIVVRSSADQRTFSLECRHCGQAQVVSLPIEADVFVAFGRAFERLHARCAPPKKAGARA